MLKFYNDIATEDIIYFIDMILNNLKTQYETLEQCEKDTIKYTLIKSHIEGLLDMQSEYVQILKSRKVI